MLVATETVWINTVRKLRFWLSCCACSFIATVTAGMTIPEDGGPLSKIFRHSYPTFSFMVLLATWVAALYCVVRLRQLRRCPRCGGAFFGTAFTKGWRSGSLENRIQGMFNRQCPECGLNLAEPSA
jgi:ribosomal protein S27AE